MSTITQYLVQAKRRSRWETLGPFEQQEEGDQAFQELVKQDDVTYARLLASGRSADGKPLYQVLRVFQPRRSRPAGSVSELAQPVARAARTPSTAVEPDLERPRVARQLDGLQTSLQVISHNVVYYETGKFSAWPANHGAQTWQWGNEILVGFTRGTYVEKEGHNVAEPIELFMARSTDGGDAWSSSPASIEDGGRPAPGDINFAHPDFALRIYHESEEYFISFDRGDTWAGPYDFGDVLSDSPVAGDEFTSRTDYIVESSRQLGSRQCLSDQR